MPLCKHCSKEVPTLHGVPKEFCKKCYKHIWYKANVAETPKQKIAREKREFDGKREGILKRDNYSCSKCSKYFEDHSKLIVHHKDGLGRGSEVKNNADSNLVTTCRSCHCTEHHESLLEARRPVYARWANKYDFCTSCGTTEVPHGGRGLCQTCYRREFPKTMKDRKRWSYKYEFCTVCGKNDAPHRGHGLCQVCYLSNYMKTYIRKPSSVSTTYQQT